MKSVAVSFWLCVVALAIPSSDVLAQNWGVCNGNPVIWRSTLNIHRNQCSTAGIGIVSGDVISAFFNGADQWDSLIGVIDSNLANPTTDCAIADDGENEVILASRAALNGANGSTITEVSCPGIGNGSIVESDVMVANDLDFAQKTGGFLGVSGRSTFVHEFGHLFGFSHLQSHNIMRVAPPHIITGDFESATIWNVDSGGLSATYGIAFSGSNLLSSSMGPTGGGIVQSYNTTSTVNVCRGAAITSKMFIGNMGDQASGGFGVRVRFSKTAPPGGYTLNTTSVYTAAEASLDPFNGRIVFLNYQIPFTLTNGLYYVYVDIDYLNQASEIDELDNRNTSGQIYNINC